MKRILFLQKSELRNVQLPQVTATLTAEWPTVRVDSAGTPEEVPEGSRYDAVITPTVPWLPEALARLASYGWIHFLSAGVDGIWDMPFEKNGVLLTKSTGVHGIPISEYVIGAMLYFAKHFDRYVEQSRDRRWERVWTDELTDRTVLVLGMGHVGSLVAQRARLLGMRACGVGRSGSLDDIALEEVDYVVVCLPLTEATRGYVDRAFIARLKRGCVLVDVSRGGVVEESAVTDALESGQLAGAALDVFATQPLVPDSPLWARRNVLLTPHISGTSPAYMERALEVFVRNARCLEAGLPPATAVDAAAGY